VKLWLANYVTPFAILREGPNVRLVCSPHCAFDLIDTQSHVHEGSIMSKGKTPGTNTGNNGGIFQEQGPRGGMRDNFVAVPDKKPLPPTTSPGSTWVQVNRTPNSRR